MEDDLERRIADLEGRSTPVNRPADFAGRHAGPDARDEYALSDQNPFEDPEALRHVVGRWLWNNWMLVAIGALTVLGASLAKLSDIFPALDEPAPDWVGAVFLAVPFTAMAVYFVVRFIKSRR